MTQTSYKPIKQCRNTAIASERRSIWYVLGLATVGACAIPACATESEPVTEKSPLAAATQALTSEAADALIRAKLDKLGGLGSFSSSGCQPYTVAADGAKIANYSDGSIVASDTYGAVVMPASFACALMGNVHETLGLPVADVAKNTDGSCKWVMFEHGAMTGGTAGPKPVYSEIDTRYAYDQAKLGCALANEVVDAAHGGKTQAFEKGTIVYRSDIGGFVLTGKVLERWMADGGVNNSIGYPASDTTVAKGRTIVGPSGPVADSTAVVSKFQNGTLYYSAASGGAFKLLPTTAWKYENDYRGPSGWLGMPTSDEKPAAGGGSYTNFEHGVLIMGPTGEYKAYDGLKMKVTHFESWGDDCAWGSCGSQDPYWTLSVTNSAGQTLWSHTYGNGSDAAWDVADVIDLGRPLPDDVLNVHFHAWDVDDSSPNDDLGDGDWKYSLANEWGKNEDIRHPIALAAGVWTIHPNAPYDASNFRNSEWWSFHNFKTPELNKTQFAAAFSDVENSEYWWRHPFNALFYKFWKKIAKDGNCYGMSLESVFANRGTSAYWEPIHDYFSDTQNGESLTESANKDDGGHQGMVYELGIKHGYQLGRNQILYSVATFLSGMTHEATSNFTLGAALQAAGQETLVNLSDYWLFGQAHTVRAYDYEVGSAQCSWLSMTCSRIYVADPNKPFSSFPTDQFIEIAPVDAFHYDGGSSNLIWEGYIAWGSRMYVTPARLVTGVQATPFADFFQLLDDGLVMLTGSDGTTSNNGAVHQITDEAGRTMFKTGLSGPPTLLSNVNEDPATRIPGIAPVSVASDGPMPFQLYAGTGIKNTSHTYDIGLASGVATGTNYDAGIATSKLSSVFRVPGTAGKPEHVRALNIGATDRAMEVELPADTNAKAIEWSISGANKSRWTKFTNLGMNPGQRIRMRTQNGGYKVIVDNYGPDTTADVTVNGGEACNPVDIGTISIKNGTNEIDFALPKTTATVTNQTFGKAGWLVAPVTISLEAKDYSGLGIDHIEYSTDGVNWAKYSGPFTYSQHGVTTLYYRARDMEGNLEVAQTISFMIDTSLPTATGTVSTTSGVKLAYAVTDPTPGSGPAGIHALVKTSAGASVETTYSLNSATVSLPTICSEVEFWGEDVAGNLQSPHVVVPDSVAPVFTSVPETVITHCTADAGRVLSVTVTDDCGVVSLTNDAPAKLPLGTTMVKWTAKDARGNTTTAVQTVIADLGDDPSCCPTGSNIIMGTSNNDVLNGTAGNDCIIGLGAQDQIRGNGGNDAISGGEGDDQIWGGAGNDWIFGGTGQDTLYGEDGADQMVGNDGVDICYGGAGDDTIWGRQGGDNLYGDAGNDKLYGGDDDDHLYGGIGTNYMDGGQNHDWYVATGTGDQCTQDGGDTVSSGSCTIITQ